MSDRGTLRLLSSVSVAFAIVLSVWTLVSGFSPSLPGYLTFLFVGLVGSFAERSIRLLEKRVAALEAGRERA